MSEFELRLLAAHEIDAYAACQASAFSSRYPPDRIEALAKELDLDRSLAAFDGADLVATSSSFSSKMTLPGLARSQVAAVTDVAVVPTHRRRGLLNSMMRRQLDDFHTNGEVLAVLYASEGTIYGRYGYGPGSFGAQYVIDKALGRLMSPKRSLTGSVRLIERQQAIEAFPLVFAAYVPTRAAEVDRPEGEWSEMLGDMANPAMGHRFYACYEQGGRIDGYAVYRVAGIDPADQWRRGVFLEDLCSLSDDAYVSLWGYLLGIDLTEELRTTGRPVDEPIRFLLEDQRRLRIARWADRSWIRLVDVPRALALRLYGEVGELIIEVEDRFCPWNEGRYALSVDGNGVGVVEQTRAPSDLVVPIDVLGSAYLGAVPFASLAEVGRVQVRTEGAARLADAMIQARRPPFCTTHF
jgi:predicted acetyltransferase